MLQSSKAAYHFRPRVTEPLSAIGNYGKICKGRVLIESDIKKNYKDFQE